MKYQLVTGNYNGETKNIDLWCRTEDREKRLLHITGFQPYMYLPENEVISDTLDWVEGVESGYISMDGDPVKKVTVIDPLQVRDHRDEFSIAYEADIRFVQRMLINAKIKSCFETVGRSRIVPWTDLVPTDGLIMPLVAYLDIETRTVGSRFPNIRYPTQPVIAITFWDTKHKKYFTIIVDDRYSSGTVQHQTEDWMVMHVRTPEELVDKAIEYLNFLTPDIVTGWNIRFDIDYTNAWLRKTLKRSRLPLKGVEIFDLLDAYKKIRPSLGNRLKEVVVREGIIKSEDMVAKEFHIEFYLNPDQRDDFILYNKKDVEYCVKLDRGFKSVFSEKWIQYDLIENFWRRKNFAGLFDINMTLSHAQRHDILWLRKAHDLNIVLPSSGKRKSDKSLEYGGVVFQPKPGLYPDVTVQDMSRYYPSILLSFPKETSPDKWGKIIQVIEDLSKERDYWDAELAKYTLGTPEYRVVKSTQIVVKHFLSGAWGYFAYKGSRIYDPVKGDFVLKTAGDGLRRLRRGATELGHDTIYGDTDSIFIEAGMDQVEDLTTYLNGILADWATEIGAEANLFKIKEDRYAKRSLFIRGEKKDVGIKKRYAQWIIREDMQECDYIHIKGFEYVRGNTSEATRAIQKRVLDAVLMGGLEGLKEYIQGEIKKIRSGEYDIDDITIPINLSLPFVNEKDKVHGEYYIGAVWNNLNINEEIIAGDRVRFFKPKRVVGLPPTNWISYIDKSNILSRNIDIDYDWLVGRTVRSPIERILEAVGISWMEILGAENLDDYFR